MIEKRGLGKGLGALISLFDEDLQEVTGEKKTGGAAVAHGTGGVEEIDVNLIDNNKNQPRKTFDAGAMQELQQSIVANGVLQPILVQRIGSRFMIVAGERRWRASRDAGLKTIPAIVREYSTKQIAEIALVENLMRSDLNEIEVANGIRKLMDQHLMTQDQVSRVLGMSRSAVANSLRLLDLPVEVREFIERRKLTSGHAKLLAALDEKRCVELARICVQHGHSVQMLAGIIEASVGGRGNFGTGERKPAGQRAGLEVRDFVEQLTRVYATRVEVAGDAKSGKITFQYSSPRELERLFHNLLR